MNVLLPYARSLVIAVFVCINIFIWSLVLTAQAHGGVLTVAFLNVGQGDAIYIEAPNGNQMLVDGGPNTAVLRELSAVMPWGDRSIDVVLATHPDKDHIAGLIDVIESYEIAQYFDSGVENDTGVYQTLLKTVSESNVPLTYARRGMRIVLDSTEGEEVYADILSPDSDVTHAETNSGSIVLHLVYGEIEFMLTGDAPKNVEAHLGMLDGKDLESDVLKAGHHGSKTSSLAQFVDLVNPQFAVISAGKDNRYGHPHQEVMQLFKDRHIQTINTADVGAIIFTSDGMSVRQK